MESNLPLFERMLALDTADMAHALAMKAHALYQALSITAIAASATNQAESEMTSSVYDMLRDWKFTELWAQRAVLSFRRSESGKQIEAVDWLVALMRACKSIGDLHHASAILAALKNPAIIRLPEVHLAFTAQLHKKQVLATAELVTKEPQYTSYLMRRAESKIFTTPVLRLLLDYLRQANVRNTTNDSQSPVAKNSKLIKMFASFTMMSDDGSDRIERFLAFQKFEYDTALKEKSIKKKSAGDLCSVSSFLKASTVIGEQTYSQPALIASLSNRLVPWPELFPPATTAAKDGKLPTHRMLSRLQSSMKLISPRTPVMRENSADEKKTLSVESPMHAMFQCFWGSGDEKTPEAKREQMLAILDDLVMQASQKAAQFPAGEWEAVLIECMTCLLTIDERPFRLLIITESTLLNWHFENKMSGMSERLRSTFDEFVSCFGSVENITDVQRLILFSLCSRVSCHIQDFRHEMDCPQWENLKDLMHFVIGFVFIEETPLIFASVDALYETGQCLDEGLLLVCDDILKKVLRDDLEASMVPCNSSDVKANFKRHLASIKAASAVFIEASRVLTAIKFMSGSRETQLFAAVKPLRRMLSECEKCFGRVGMTSRLRSLNPFKSATTAPTTSVRAEFAAKTVKRTSLINTITLRQAPSIMDEDDKKVVKPSSVVGDLARAALQESIERHRTQRETTTATPLIKRISHRNMRRKSVSDHSPISSRHQEEEEAEPASAANEEVLVPDRCSASVVGSLRKKASSHSLSKTVPSHHRRRSSFPSVVILEDVFVEETAKNIADEAADEAKATVTAIVKESELKAGRDSPSDEDSVPSPSSIADLIGDY